MAKTQAIQKVVENSCKVAVDVSKGIAVHAKGDPATIVAVGAAAAVVAVSVGVGAGVYYSAKALFGKDDD